MVRVHVVKGYKVSRDVTRLAPIQPRGSVGDLAVGPRVSTC